MVGAVSYSSLLFLVTAVVLHPSKVVAMMKLVAMGALATSVCGHSSLIYPKPRNAVDRYPSSLRLSSLSFSLLTHAFATAT